ncbi:efflux RND transporter permease subunit, partial [Oleiphilus sp. HI0132]
IITLDDNYDPQTLLTEIKNRIDAVNNLPADAERPVVSLSKRKREVISVAVSGDLSEREIRQQAQHVRDQLLDIEGITQVELDGVRDYEISIEVNERVLQKYG